LCAIPTQKERLRQFEYHSQRRRTEPDARRSSTSLSIDVAMNGPSIELTLYCIYWPHVTLGPYVLVDLRFTCRQCAEMSCTELLDIVIVFVVIRIEMIVSLTLPALQYRHLAPPAMGHSALAMCPPPATCTCAVSLYPRQYCFRNHSSHSVTYLVYRIL